MHFSRELGWSLLVGDSQRHLASGIWLHLGLTLFMMLRMDYIA